MCSYITADPLTHRSSQRIFWLNFPNYPSSSLIHFPFPFPSPKPTTTEVELQVPPISTFSPRPTQLRSPIFVSGETQIQPLHQFTCPKLLGFILIFFVFFMFLHFFMLCLLRPWLTWLWMLVDLWMEFCLEREENKIISMWERLLKIKGKIG